MEKQNKIVLIDIDDTMFNTALLKESQFAKFEMYDDVYDSLEELAKVATLGIFSQGEVAFQMKKLQQTNIHHYFVEEHVHIMEDKLKTMNESLAKYAGKGKIFLIEDRLDVLQQVKICNPDVFTIWMKRGRYADRQRNPVRYIPDATIRDLHQAIPLIQTN